MSGNSSPQIPDDSLFIPLPNSGGKNSPFRAPLHDVDDLSSIRVEVVRKDSVKGKMSGKEREVLPPKNAHKVKSDTANFVHEKLSECVE